MGSICNEVTTRKIENFPELPKDINTQTQEACKSQHRQIHRKSHLDPLSWYWVTSTAKRRSKQTTQEKREYLHWNDIWTKLLNFRKGILVIMMFEEYLKKEERRKERNGKERSEGGREAGGLLHPQANRHLYQTSPAWRQFWQRPFCELKEVRLHWALVISLNSSQESLWLLILKVVGRPSTWAGGASVCSQVWHGRAEQIKVSDRVFSAPCAPQLEHSDFPASTSSVASDLYKRQIRPCDSSS